MFLKNRDVHNVGTRTVSPETFLVSKPYSDDYVAHTQRGVTQGKPWSLSEELINRGGIDKDLLDIGCGGSAKTAPIASHYRSLVALDPSPAMRRASIKTFRALAVQNARVVAGYGEALPYPDASFDVVTSMLAGFHFAEIHRVLRPSGQFVIEGIGPRDHALIKEEFGCDAMGRRGQFADCDANEFMDCLRNMVDEFFPEAQIWTGFWKRWLPFQTLVGLLETTPMVRNFDIERDREALFAVRSKYETPLGVETTENRVLITGKKSDTNPTRKTNS